MHLPANWFLPVPLQFFEPPWRRPMYRNPLFKNYNICGGGSAVCCGRQVQEAVLFSRPGHGLARRRRRRRRPRSHSRSNFAFTNIECFAQVLSILLCNFKTSEVFCFVSHLIKACQAKETWHHNLSITFFCENDQWYISIYVFIYFQCLL